MVGEDVELTSFEMMPEVADGQIRRQEFSTEGAVPTFGGVSGKTNRNHCYEQNKHMTSSAFRHYALQEAHLVTKSYQRLPKATKSYQKLPGNFWYHFYQRWLAEPFSFQRLYCSDIN